MLEINGDHPIFAKLKALKETDEEKLGVYTRLLYAQALLIEGLSLEDPVAFSEELCRLMEE